MKIAVEESVILNSVNDLLGKTDNDLYDFQYFIILNDFKGYQYFRTSGEGTFQPTGMTATTGWWKDNSFYLIEKELKIVQDSFAFSASTCVEVDALQYFYFMYNNDKIDIEGFRDKLQIYADANFSGMTASDQKVCVRFDIFNSGITEQQKTNAVATYFTEAEHRKLKLNIWEEIPLGRERRFNEIKIKFGEFEEDGLITKDNIVSMWREVRHLIEDWINTPNTDIYDWINTTGVHTSDGFSTKTYYNAQIKDEMTKILIEGVY